MTNKKLQIIITGCIIELFILILIFGHYTLIQKSQFNHMEKDIEQLNKRIDCINYQIKSLKNCTNITDGTYITIPTYFYKYNDWRFVYNDVSYSKEDFCVIETNDNSTVLFINVKLDDQKTDFYFSNYNVEIGIPLKLKIIDPWSINETN